MDGMLHFNLKLMTTQNITSRTFEAVYYKTLDP